MKQILSFLLCIVLLKAQAFAIHGPLEGSDSGVILVGTYSGTLIPIEAGQGTKVFDFDTGLQTGNMNTIGLFTVALPTSGIGTGSFVIFTAGRSLAGTITAVGNPNEGSMTGILEATFTYTDFQRDDNYEIILPPVALDREAAVRGTIEADIISSVSNLTFASAQTANFGRLEGEAETGAMYLGPFGAGELVTDGIVRYKVDGVKQSLTADAATQLAGLGTDGGGDDNNLGLLDLLF
jgi:hypothetical protein